jgi:hypothetical protein
LALFLGGNLKVNMKLSKLMKKILKYFKVLGYELGENEPCTHCEYGCCKGWWCATHLDYCWEKTWWRRFQTRIWQKREELINLWWEIKYKFSKHNENKTYTFKYWCYNIREFAPYDRSVEVYVEAHNEEEALEVVRKLVKRENYKLETIEENRRE